MKSGVFHTEIFQNVEEIMFRYYITVAISAADSSHQIHNMVLPVADELNIHSLHRINIFTKCKNNKYY